MTTYLHAVNDNVNNCTVIALPTGVGINGEMYQLQRADGSTFFAHMTTQVDDDTIAQLGIVVGGFEINSTNPLPVYIASGSSGGSSSSGVIGTTTTPNVSTLADPTTPAHQAAVLGPGVSGTYALTVQGVAAGTPLPVSGTFWQATQPISAAALPLPAGAATLAKQPALGTAGTAASDVITIQGIASMVAIKVDGSAITQPVSIATAVAVTGAFYQATQPVSLASSVVTTNGGGTSTVTAVAASTTVATALAANAARRKWIITNDTASIMYVKLGAGAAATSYTYALSPKTASSAGGSCEGTDTTAITAILASGTGNAMVTEVTA